MADPESSVQSVISNDDLLTEILVRLPILSVVLFKPVSKHWFSLIKKANPTFRRILDPVSGLFIYTSYKKDGSERSYSYKFVPLDIRIPVPATNFTIGQDVHGDFQVLHACNGLLLRLTYSGKLIVYNPSINEMFKVLPEPNNVTDYDYHFIYGGLRVAFDPTKSPHYKVIYADLVEGDHPWVQIQTFSSEMGNWSVCGHHFSPRSFVLFGNGVYLNEAIYWISSEFRDDHDGDDFFKLDIMNEHPVLTASRIPLTECKLFASGGCLLLVGGKGSAHSGHFSIYEKRNDNSQWSLKYIVNLHDIIKPFPKSWSIWSNISCIVSEEEKEDYFLVMELDKKVVQYKIVSKTLNTICDLEPDSNLVSCFEFIPSFANLTFRRSLDPVSGLFIHTSLKKDGSERSYSYNFVPLDIRIPVPATNFTFGPDVHGDFQVLHACNGLFLCLTHSEKLIVCNPSITKMFKVLPEPDNVTHYDYHFIYGGLRIAFDPTKSPHYKVIYADLVEGDHPLDSWVQIQTFSSETGNWSLCEHHFSPRSFVLFGNGVYLNGALYWINDEFHDDHDGDGDGDDFFKLDIMNEHLVLTASRIPLTECKLFESGGCLLLVGGEGSAHSGHFSIYEKRNEYSQWSLKYIVNLHDIIKPFPKSWSIWSNISCIVSEEEKEDSFLVMELDKKVVQYKIVSKTLNTICDLGPDGNLVSCSQFIPSFANV